MKLNIGVVGVGAIGQDHIRRFVQVLQNCQVVAMSDISKENLDKVNKSLNLNAKIYSDGHELIRSKEVNAVVITSWDPTHEEYALAAINEGKYVFCEKPLAVTAEGCKKIIDAEMKQGKRLLQVGFMRPFDTGYRALKQVITEGQIGRPLLLHAAHRNVTNTYTDESIAITNTLIHELDVHRWLLDDDYVSAQVVFPNKSSLAPGELKDPQLVIFKTAKGTIINVEVFANCQYGYDIQCEVVGEKGIAKLPDPSQIVMRKEAKFYIDILVDWKDRFIAAYDVELQAFIDNVISGRFTQGASAWDAYAAAVAADTCIKAQKSGAIEPIAMPKMPDFYKK